MNGDGDVGHIEILASNPGASWVATQRSWGATWKFDIPQGTKGPYSVRITALESGASVTAYNVIPADWAPGRYYYSRINFA